MIPEWLLAIALTCFVLDLFLMSEGITYVGLAVMAGYVTWRLEVSSYWIVLTYLLALVGCSVLFYPLIWCVRRVLQRKGALLETNDRMIGQTGEIVKRQGQLFFRWEGELLPIANSEGLSEGDSAIAESFKDGKVTIHKK